MSFLDKTINANVTTNYEHYLIRAGFSYYMWVNSTVNDTETIEIVLKPPETKVNLYVTSSYVVSESGVLAITENVESLAGGVAFTPINKNRNSGRPSGALTAQTGVPGANITYSGGDIIYEANSINQSIILQNNVNTIFQLTSSAASNKMSLVLSWCECMNQI